MTQAASHHAGDNSPASIDRSLEGASSPVRSTLADPGAWAVTAFGTTSFMLGMFNAGLLDVKGAAIVLPAALFFGGLVQIIVAILEVIRGNVFGAVVFGTYGPFWVIYWAIETRYGHEIPAAQLGSAVALFLAMFAVLTFYFFIASLRTDAVLVGVFLLIFVGLVLLAIGAGAPSPTLTKVGGWVTLAFAVLAWYHAAADMIGATFGRAVLPVGPLKH